MLFTILSLSALYIDNTMSEKTECTDIIHDIVVAPEKVLLILLQKIKVIMTKIKEDKRFIKIFKLYQNRWSLNIKIVKIVLKLENITMKKIILQLVMN